MKKCLFIFYCSEHCTNTTYLTLTKFLWDRNYYSPHFLGINTEAQRA